MAVVINRTRNGGRHSADNSGAGRFARRDMKDGGGRRKNTRGARKRAAVGEW